MTPYLYRTHSGLLIDLAKPDPDLIRMDDIAHHLARVNRFGGSIRDQYSVAAHSTYMAREVLGQYGSRTLARGCLLHDAGEAYLGDQTSPLKRFLQDNCPRYNELLLRWDFTIERVFDVSFVDNGAVHDADLRARLSETRDLFENYPREELHGGEEGREPYPTKCRVQSADEAEWEFLAMAQKLGLMS